MEKLILFGEHDLVDDFAFVFSRFYMIEKYYDDIDNFVIVRSDCYVNVLCFFDESNIISEYEKNGYLYKTDFFVASDLFFLLDINNVGEIGPSWLFRKMYFATRKMNIICDHTSYEAEIKSDGNVYLCCFARLPYTIGNMKDESFSKIWNSVAAQIIRRSTQNGSCCFCNGGSCQELNKYNYFKSEHFRNTTRFPINLNIAIDDECNLKCIMCRENVRITSDLQFEERLIWADKVIDEIIPYGKNIIIAGDGEVFFSKIYAYLLERLVSRNTKYKANLSILSNGNIFNISMVEKLSRYFESIMIMISVDAATAETYRKIRRGGDFEKVLHTIQTVQILRESGIVDNAELRFVVQKENYMEMEKFVSLGRHYGIDQICFTRLVKSSSMSDEEFERNSLLDTRGVLKQEYRAWFAKHKVLGNKINVDESFIV